MSEREPQHVGQPPLPPELAEFLRGQELAAVWETTDRGTVLVVKAPGREIDSLRGPVPIHLQHELHRHPRAPVIRTVVTIYDRPQSPLALETFTNVADETQRAEFAALAEQPELGMLFYDEMLSLRLTKGLRLGASVQIRELVGAAETIRAGINPEQYDFDLAKAAVIVRTRL